ncbi:MAG: diguanylate cyclase [Planctomycetes bacterium]|nr:diguanylate cyclase [Planctomycetota bacterium]
MTRESPGTAKSSAEPCPRVLIVEDDQDQRELIAESLEMYFDQPADRRIRQVGSAAEVRALNPADFDVILLDYNLPDASGLDVLDEITRRADLPVIFVTGENVVTTAAEAIRHGAQDYITKMGDYLFAIPLLVEKNIRQHRIRQENTRLHAELAARIEEVKVKNIQLQESLAEMERMAATDYLTGLTNRRHFADLLESNFSEAQRYHFDLTCVMIDLDNYKTFNDTLGHQMGDKILITTAELIKATLRASDLAARFGGDEFVLLLPHTSTKLALSVAERIRHELAIASSRYLRIGQTLTTSMGLANLNEDRPTSAEVLLAMADRAMYAAKDAGKNRLIIHKQLLQAAPANA